MSVLSILLSEIPGISEDVASLGTAGVLLSRNEIEVLCVADEKAGFLQLEAELYEIEDIYDLDDDAQEMPAFTEVCKRIMNRLRHAQFCYAETGGFQLAMRPGTGTVILLDMILLETASSSQVARKFDSFLQVADFWKRNLPQVAKGKEMTESPEQSSFSELMGKFGLRI